MSIQISFSARAPSSGTSGPCASRARFAWSASPRPSDSDSSFGVWGGLTERERRALLRRFPEVTDWSEWLRQEDDDLVAEIHARRAPRILARVR